MLTHSSSLCHLRLGKTPTFHVRTIFHFLSSNIRLLSLSSDFCKKMDLSLHDVEEEDIELFYDDFEEDFEEGLVRNFLEEEEEEI